MKNLYRFLLLSTVGIVLSGCELTLTPEASIDPTKYFKTATDLRLWTNQYYTILDNADDAAGENADDNIDRSLGDVISGVRSADSEKGWSQNTWKPLRSMNYFFEHSSVCPDKDALRIYTGVTHFFRAYFYFVKVRRYGDVPWYDKVIGSTETEQLKKPRDDRGYVMDKVMSDFDNAIEMLPRTKSISTVTRWAALAFKSRAALYEGTFRKYHALPDADKYLTQAAKAAELFITESGYKLYEEGTEPYRDLFCSDNAKEIEVVLARLYNFADLNLSTGVQFNIANNQQGFTRRFINHYLMADGSRFTDKADYQTMFYTDETKGRDPRLGQTILCPGYIQKGDTEVQSNSLLAMTGYQPIKFVSDASRDGASKGTADWPLMRTAEVYLNYAEAKAELGTLSQTDLNESINLIRKRAKMGNMELATANAAVDPYLLVCYPNVTKSDNTGVILEIRRERTVEMVMEGQRMFDMFRWREGTQMVNKTNPYYGCYIPGPGLYDMSGDGKADLEIYLTTPQSKLPNAKKINSDITLSQGTYGYITAWPAVTYTWKEDRDYLWPIPNSERVLTGGALTQNPKW